MISPVHCYRQGVPADAVCTFYGITEEELDAQIELAERRRRDVPAPAGKTLMTPLLKRDDLDRWETRTAERL